MEALLWAVELPKSLVRERKALKSGRRVATFAAVMASPGSMADQITTSVEEKRKSLALSTRTLTYGMRTTAAAQALCGVRTRRGEVRGGG